MTAFLIVLPYVISLLAIGLCVALGRALSKAQRERDAARRDVNYWSRQCDEHWYKWRALEKSLSEAYAAIESRAKLIESREAGIRHHARMRLEVIRERNELLAANTELQKRLADAQKSKTSKRPKS